MKTISRPSGLALLVALAVLALACGGSATPGASGSPPASNDPPANNDPGGAVAVLAGRTFLSTRVTEGDRERPLAGDTRIRLAFDADRIVVSAGCNSASGRYRVVDGRLATDGLAVTEMGCDPVRQAQDEWLFRLLGAGPTVRLTGTDLALEANGTRVELADRAIADPDRPLVGSKWIVESIVEGDAVSSLPVGVEPHLVFAADGSFELSAGCNEGGGRYETDGPAIRFSDIVTTKIGCPGARGQVETLVLAALRADSVGFRIEADRLRLTTAAGGLDLRAGGSR